MSAPRPFWADQEGQPRPRGEELLASHHAVTMAFVQSALGLAPSLADELLKVCDGWPNRAEAERWRRAIAVEAYRADRATIETRGAA